LTGLYKVSTMKIDSVSLILILVLVGVLLFAFSSCQLTCGSSSEGYWSLPFAGGDIRTYAPDPKKIEGKLGEAVDEADMSGGYPL